MYMTDDMVAAAALTVGRVAELVGVSVRTLHHWDEIGLVSPARTLADYRLYSADDVARVKISTSTPAAARRRATSMT